MENNNASFVKIWGQSVPITRLCGTTPLPFIFWATKLTLELDRVLLTETQPQVSRSIDLPQQSSDHSIIHFTYLLSLRFSPTGSCIQIKRTDKSGQFRTKEKNQGSFLHHRGGGAHCFTLPVIYLYVWGSFPTDTGQESIRKQDRESRWLYHGFFSFLLLPKLMLSIYICWKAQVSQSPLPPGHWGVCCLRKASPAVRISMDEDDEGLSQWAEGDNGRVSELLEICVIPPPWFMLLELCGCVCHDENIDDDRLLQIFWHMMWFHRPFFLFPREGFDLYVCGDQPSYGLSLGLTPHCRQRCEGQAFTYSRRLDWYRTVHE